MPQIEQVRRIPFNDEEIGMGFNSETGLAVGTALEGFTVSTNSAAPGQEVTSSISIITSHEELQKTLGLSFDAKGRYGFFSGSAKATFSEKSNYNLSSTFLVASVVVQNSFKRGKGFKVIPTAQELLNPNQLEIFKHAFGDSFVRGLQTGGEFYAVIRITSVSESTQSDLALTLQAEYNGLATSGSFKAAFNTATSNSKTHAEFTATMYQNAGTGAMIAPTVQIEDVIDRFRHFPEIVAASPAAYETEIATYDTIPLPLPTPIEQEAFLQALADAREKKLRYIQTRNDIDFAVRNPDFFDDLPPIAQLQEASSTYTKLMNAVTEHGIKLSKGQMVPPKFFDPTALSPPLNEPAPVIFKKKETGLLTIQGGQPSVGSMIKFEIPDHCQITTKMTVNLGGSITGDPNIGGPIQNTRMAGIGLLKQDDLQRFVAVILSIDQNGRRVNGVNGNFKATPLLFAAKGTEFGGDTIHLRIVVLNRRVRKTLFSIDGNSFTPTDPHPFVNNAPSPLGSKAELALFAWSQDSTQGAAQFTPPKIELLPPPAS